MFPISGCSNSTTFLIFSAIFTLWPVVTAGLTIDILGLRTTEEPAKSVQNANHIFNAIHSSMRQWGSSLNHNGMSFFLASMPKGTQLYHGAPTKEPVKGIEWLAFEPEHALAFARPWRPGGSRPTKENGMDAAWEHQHQPGPNKSQKEGHLSAFWERARDEGRPQPFDTTGGGLGMEHDESNEDHQQMATPNLVEHSLHQQQPMYTEEGNREVSGYLHTYRTKHPLSLLYIDGLSAGKTNMGTLDSTDYVLQPFNVSIVYPVMGDWERAYGLCNMSVNEWDGRIDGFIRTEMGFEIILCDFEEHLEVDFISQPLVPKGLGRGFGANMSYYRAVASRFDGIGGGRVQINYDNFVTAFAYNADLFTTGTEHPQLVNVSNTTRAVIREDVTKMIFLDTPPAGNKDAASRRDWQSIADMIVMRYSDHLAYLSSSSIHSIEEMQAEINNLLRPYVDLRNRNSRLEIERCATQYIPPFLFDPPRPLAAEAIHTIAYKVCDVLVNATHATSLESAQASIRNLVDYLRWTTWKKCGSCELDEVCFIPIWPVGRKQDYEKPACQNSVPLGRNDSYWAGEPGRGRDKGGKD